MKYILDEIYLLAKCKKYQKIPMSRSEGVKIIKKINKMNYFSIKGVSSMAKAILAKVVNSNQKEHTVEIHIK